MSHSDYVGAGSLPKPRYSRAMRTPPPGRLVSVGTHRLHLQCEGDGTPSVVFDAALGGSSLSWSFVFPAVARWTRACAYDRAGFGWSEAGPLPRTAGRIADELHTLLRTAGVPPPYVLVGHSFGGLVARIFAARHRKDVSGLVLIEPAYPADWMNPSEHSRALIERGVTLCRYGTTAARFGLARFVAMLVRAGALGPARALARVVGRGALRAQDEGVLAPVWKLPPAARRVLGELWSEPRFFEALGSQIETICESATELAKIAEDENRDLPMVVMTAASATEHRMRSDASFAQLFSRGRQIIVPDSGHWIPLDAPQAVINAITEMVTTAPRP
jgi:pimeloyl-ACP methyl ester carboxylesterase